LSVILKLLLQGNSFSLFPFFIFESNLLWFLAPGKIFMRIYYFKLDYVSKIMVYISIQCNILDSNGEIATSFHIPTSRDLKLLAKTGRGAVFALRARQSAGLCASRYLSVGSQSALWQIRTRHNTVNSITHWMAIGFNINY